MRPRATGAKARQTILDIPDKLTIKLGIKNMIIHSKFTAGTINPNSIKILIFLTNMFPLF